MAGEDEILKTDTGAGGAEEVVETRVTPAAGETAGKDADQQPIERKGKFDDKRANIYAKARQRREPAEGEEEFKAYEAEDERRIFGKNVETRADREARRQEVRDGVVEPVIETRAETRTVAEPEAQAVKRRLKVNGQEIELDDERVVALAQQALAADNVLEKAKAVKAAYESKLEALNSVKTADHSGDGGKATETQKASEATIPDDADLDDIIDRIQVGDKDQAKAALQKYGNLTIERAENRIMEKLGDIDSRIAETTRITNENERRRHESAQVLADFTKDNPEFKEDVSLQQALFTETVQQMRKHLMDVGVRPETLDDLRKSHGFDDNKAVGFAYRALQDKGHVLPDHGTVLRSSAKSLREKFGVRDVEQPQTTEPPSTEIRTERKQMMAPQPRRANIAPTAEAKERDIQTARLEAVRQMRAARRGGR